MKYCSKYLYCFGIKRYCATSSTQCSEIYVQYLKGWHSFITAVQKGCGVKSSEGRNQYQWHDLTPGVTWSLYSLSCHEHVAPQHVHDRWRSGAEIWGYTEDTGKSPAAGSVSSLVPLLHRRRVVRACSCRWVKLWWTAGVFGVFVGPQLESQQLSSLSQYNRRKKEGVQTNLTEYYRLKQEETMMIQTKGQQNKQ